MATTYVSPSVDLTFTQCDLTAPNRRALDHLQARAKQTEGSWSNLDCGCGYNIIAAFGVHQRSGARGPTESRIISAKGVRQGLARG